LPQYTKTVTVTSEWAASYPSTRSTFRSLRNAPRRRPIVDSYFTGEVSHKVGKDIYIAILYSSEILYRL